MSVDPGAEKMRAKVLGACWEGAFYRGSHKADGGVKRKGKRFESFGSAASNRPKLNSARPTPPRPPWRRSRLERQ